MERDHIQQAIDAGLNPLEVMEAIDRAAKRHADAILSDVKDEAVAKIRSMGDHRTVLAFAAAELLRFANLVDPTEKTASKGKVAEEVAKLTRVENAVLGEVLGMLARTADSLSVDLAGKLCEPFETDGSSDQVWEKVIQEIKSERGSDTSNPFSAKPPALVA